MVVTFYTHAYFSELFYKSKGALVPCLDSLISTLGGGAAARILESYTHLRLPQLCLDETM